MKRGSPRQPLERAILSGQAQLNRRYFAQWGKLKSGDLGPMPKQFMGDKGFEKAWNDFVDEIPWLQKSDRMVLMQACTLRAKFLDDPPLFTVKEHTLLRMLLSLLGATPADRSRVDDKAGDEDGEEDEFFAN